MMTLVKKIFTWWNVDTFGTRLKTIFFGKYAGTDSFGNKYYENKNGKRWVIYSDEIDASKIPVEWYSWMHFTPNKIEKKHELDKYDWQKPHQPNPTGTENAYYPNKDKDNVGQKKYRSWKSD
jgi:NADH:ubiquinone oxidoreductase subunit